MYSSVYPFISDDSRIRLDLNGVNQKMSNSMVSFLMVVKFPGILPEERKELEADWGSFTTFCQYAESGIKLIAV